MTAFNGFEDGLDKFGNALNLKPVGVAPFEFPTFGVFAFGVFVSYGVKPALYGVYDVFICNLVIPEVNAFNDDVEEL